MPKNGTATNTEIASADVVESEPVGGSYPGMIAQRLDTAMNRNKVPMKAEIFRRMVEAHFLDLFLDRGDHDFQEALPARDVHFGHELARDQHAPTVITSINTQVVTIVLLSTRKPYRQKTSSSGLRRNGWSPLPMESALPPALA